MLGQVQEPVAFKAPVPSELVEYKNGGVSAVREGVPGKPRDTKAEEILQPRLCEQGKSEKEGRGYKWECFMMWRLTEQI